VAHSEGFNPHPKIVFAAAIPLGIESFCEFSDVKIIETDEIAASGGELNPEEFKSGFPQGINIIEVYEPETDFKNIDSARYNIFINTNRIGIDELNKFFEGDIFFVKETKKSKSTINLKDYICEINISDGKIDVVLKSNQQMYLNPENIIKSIREKYPGALDDYSIQKLQVHDVKGGVFE